MLLFHRTTIGDARTIVKKGFDDAKWRFLDLEETGAGREVKVVGVWLSDRPLGEDEGPGGDALLEVDLEVSESALEPFEIEGIFWDAHLWVVPAKLVNANAQIRILGVDPRTSWWYEVPDDD